MLFVFLQEPEPECRDQGFTRPRVLILVPFRNAAFRIINTIINEVGCFPVAKCVPDTNNVVFNASKLGLQLPEKHRQQVLHQQRFQEEFGPEADEPETDVNAGKPAGAFVACSCLFKAHLL